MEKNLMSNVEFALNKAASYYADKLQQYGPTAKGVDWNSETAQKIRFEILQKIIDPVKSFSLIDYGCGYGALYDYLTKQNLNFHYFGLDIQPQLIEAAAHLHATQTNCSFKLCNESTEIVDYVLSSGVFTLKFDCSEPEWQEYILSLLHSLNQMSSKGFAFNCLTKYSDQDRMKDYLYYADPCFFFDYCKKHFSKNVALLHDYGLYEFTILVRKDI